MREKWGGERCNSGKCASERKVRKYENKRGSVKTSKTWVTARSRELGSDI